LVATVSLKNCIEDVFVLADGDRGTLRLIVKSAVYKYDYINTLIYLVTYFLYFNAYLIIERYNTHTLIGKIKRSLVIQNLQQ